MFHVTAAISMLPFEASCHASRVHVCLHRFRYWLPLDVFTQVISLVLGCSRERSFYCVDNGNQNGTVAATKNRPPAFNSLIARGRNAAMSAWVISGKCMYICHDAMMPFPFQDPSQGLQGSPHTLLHFQDSKFKYCDADYSTLSQTTKELFDSNHQCSRVLGSHMV